MTDFHSEADTETDLPKLETSTFEAPALWASALVNGDLSGLDFYGPDCVAEFEAWTRANAGRLNVVDCSNEPHMGRWNGVQTELLTYTTLGYDAPLPADYEPCGQCGLDHTYEQSEAQVWHRKNDPQSVE